MCFYVYCLPKFKFNQFTDRMRITLFLGDETFPGIMLCTFSGSVITNNNNNNNSFLIAFWSRTLPLMHTLEEITIIYLDSV